MSKDRFIQIVAVVLAAGCVLGAASLSPRINEQRRELELTFDTEVGDRIDPRYAITTAALGSFRGLAVDVLWYRIERLKQEGRYFEANTLAEWITALQPRYPQVWRFQAWNMAYNISVLTHTEEERWEWVMRGIRLLREQGVPNNPDSVQLYNELAWIFFHKMGGDTDDAHWYYKRTLAEQWQENLGVPTIGLRGAEAADAFSPIAEIADQYLQLDRLPREMRERLTELGEANPEHGRAFRRLRDSGLVRFRDRSARLEQELRDQREHRLADELEQMRRDTAERMQRTRRNPVRLLAEEHEGVPELIERMEDAGWELGPALTRRIGWFEVLARHLPGAAHEAIMQGRAQLNLSDRDRALWALLNDPRHDEAFDTLTAFLRAQLLIDEHGMDPQYMHQLMVEYGPLDWRHPASHSLYWASKGIDRVQDLTQPESAMQSRVDVVNTKRLVVHSLQSLYRSGRVQYNLPTQNVDLLPEPGFIESFDQANVAAQQLAESLDISTGGFIGGHENFLLRASQIDYLYGDMDRADRNFERARELYGDRPHHARYGTFDGTVEDYVMNTLAQDIDQLHVARGAIDGMLSQAFVIGLGADNRDQFDRLVSMARRIYERHQRERDYGPAQMQRARLQMPATFRATLVETYVNFMASGRVSLLDRARIMENTPADLVEEAFPRIGALLRDQATAAGFDPDAMFPLPAGLSEADLSDPEEADLDAAAGTIERN